MESQLERQSSDSIYPSLNKLGNIEETQLPPQYSLQHLRVNTITVEKTQFEIDDGEMVEPKKQATNPSYFRICNVHVNNLSMCINVIGFLLGFLLFVFFWRTPRSSYSFFWACFIVVPIVFMIANVFLLIGQLNKSWVLHLVYNVLATLLIVYLVLTLADFIEWLISSSQEYDSPMLNSFMINELLPAIALFMTGVVYLCITIYIAFRSMIFFRERAEAKKVYFVNRDETPIQMVTKF